VNKVESFDDVKKSAFPVGFCYMYFCCLAVFVSLIRNRICNSPPEPGGRKVARFFMPNTNPNVGASLLAMDVNDNACCLNARVVPAFFASRLAPTGGLCEPIIVRAEN
jgi:hypothetical protein